MRRFLVTAVAIVALLAAPAVPAGAGDAGGAGGAGGAGPGPVRPDRAGPYRVGLTTVDMVDPGRDGRTLRVDVWYPAAPRARGETAAIDLVLTEIELPGVLAAPAAARRSFPLVVFSHGHGGGRSQSWFLMQTLASHGFVVAAPDHTGNTATDIVGGTDDPIEVAAVNRPRDVSFVIDQVLAWDRDPASGLYRRIDGQRVAVVGHSFGGFTALATAAGLLDYRPDPRVDAIVPITPVSSPFTDEELASVAVPTLLIGATADGTTPIEPEVTRPWDLVSGRPAYRVDVQGAAHASFANVCEIRDAYVAAGADQATLDYIEGLAAEACGPGVLPIRQAHRVTNLYVVSFLRTVLRHDVRYARFLTPRAVDRLDLPVRLFVRPSAVAAPAA